MAAGTPPCAWCGNPSVVVLIVEPARYTKRKGGEKVCTQQAITAPACRAHSDRTQNQPPPVKPPAATGSPKPTADQLTIYDALGGDVA